MSYLDQPTLTGWQKLGCAGYFMVVAVVSYIALMIVVFDGWDEPPMPRWQSLLIFPGSALLAIFGGGALLAKLFMRDKN